MSLFKVILSLCLIMSVYHVRAEDDWADDSGSEVTDSTAVEGSGDIQEDIDSALEEPSKSVADEKTENTAEIEQNKAEVKESLKEKKNQKKLKKKKKAKMAVKKHKEKVKKHKAEKKAKSQG